MASCADRQNANSMRWQVYTYDEHPDFVGAAHEGQALAFHKLGSLHGTAPGASSTSASSTSSADAATRLSLVGDS